MAEPRYRVIDELGRGGMGVVFRALQLDLNREVALKVLPPQDASGEEMRRFQREVKICCGLAHPNIVRIYDGGDMNGQPFYTMEIVRGEDLEKVTVRRGAVPFAEATKWLEQAADALAYVHERNLVHRDIKPSNLMINEAGDLLLMDFGLARDPTSTMLTEDGAVVGTPRFLPPEGFVGQQMGPSQDIYALALCAHELISGKKWEDCATLAQLAGLVVTGPAPTLEGQAGVPAWFVELQERALSKTPSERPTAAQYRDALKQGGTRARRTSSSRTALSGSHTRPPASRSLSAPSAPSAASGISGPVTAGLAIFIGGLAAAGWIALRSEPAPLASPSAVATVAAPAGPPPVVAATKVTIYPTDRDVLIDVELSRPWACVAQVVRRRDGSVVGEVEPPKADRVLHTFAPLEPATEYLLRVRPKGAKGGVAGWRFKSLPKSHTKGVENAISALRKDPEQMEYWASFFRTTPDRRTLAVIRDWLRTQTGEKVDIRKVAWLGEALRSHDIVGDLIDRLPKATDTRVVTAVLNASALVRHPRASAVGRDYLSRPQPAEVVRSAALGVALERTAEAADFIARHFEKFPGGEGHAEVLLGAHRERARSHFTRWAEDAGRAEGMWVQGIQGLELLGEDEDVAALERVIAPRVHSGAGTRGIIALMLIGSPAARAAVARLFRATPHSAHLIWAVGCLGIATERDGLGKVLNGPVGDLKRHAAAALGLLASPDAVPALEAAQGGADPAVRAAAAWALARLRTSPPDPAASKADVPFSVAAHFDRTGFLVEPGDTLELSISGTWNVAGEARPVNPDRGIPVPAAQAQLVARAHAGTEETHLHRAPVNLVAGRAGEVLLTIWDPLPWDFTKLPAIPGDGTAVVHIERER